MNETGLLSGLTVLELGGRGPVPFTGALLADHGATVVRIDKPLTPQQAASDLVRPAHPLRRSKTTVTIDLGDPSQVALVMRMMPRIDVVLEGFRPGKASALGLGAEDCWRVNPQLVYGSVSGWGDKGPFARLAGHDINYLAISGILGQIGAEETGPVPPLNIIGDYGAGSLLAFGVVAALHARSREGRGRSVSTSIFESALYFASRTHVMTKQGTWLDGLGENDLQGAAPYYGVFQTADRRHLAVGPIEARFYREFLDRVGLPGTDRQKESWATSRQLIAVAIAKRPIAEWEAVFAGSDCCVTPVLTIEESAIHEQTRAVLGGRDAYTAVPTLDGRTAPAAGEQDDARVTRDLLQRLIGTDGPEIDAIIERQLTHDKSTNDQGESANA